jgi:glycosyltransferase involved in cell wall biosynthesis
VALRILHAIHDFLPRHAAGSELYAFHLCRELASRHHVHVLAAEYDPARPQGSITWRVHEGLPVIEIVNNWDGSFADTYRSARIGAQLERVLHATQPDVVHVHSLLNLSFELPRLARARGAAVVATLHDHSLVCPAGGQRLHLAERTVCDRIDAARCGACFPHSPFHAQMSVAALGNKVGFGGAMVGRAARWFVRRAPAAAALVRREVQARTLPIPAGEVQARLDALREVFDAVQLFVAPSKAVADEHERLGLHRSKLLVSDYGFVRAVARPRLRSGPAGDVPPAASSRQASPLRIGFVGTLVWHKGLHVLLDAARQLPVGAWEIEAWGALDTFPDYTASLRTLAAGMPVRFRGSFPNEQAADVYSRFDLLVVPSLWPENSPLVIHEAFMAGVPVVAARIGGIPELVHDGVNGVLYDAHSAPSLADALRGLILRPDRIADMAARAPHVKSIDEDAKDWERRYESALHEAQSGPAGAP